jgi:hypothetical protein
MLGFTLAPTVAHVPSPVSCATTRVGHVKYGHAPHSEHVVEFAKE